MRNKTMYNTQVNYAVGLNFSRTAVIGLILVIALIAFEVFNFDTTRYALQNLLGDVSFAGLRWATILAIAFCSIDFAGLARLFTPEQGREEPKAVWYLMGAWLLGATMNALMTWWAVALTLLSHDFGNEVMSREQLLQIVPIFVAALVWLTRILFIGAFSVAGEYIFKLDEKRDQLQPARFVPGPSSEPVTQNINLGRDSNSRVPPLKRPPLKKSGAGQRIRNRPPSPRPVTRMPAGMHARSRRR